MSPPRGAVVAVVLLLAAGKPALVTDGLARQLAGKVKLDAPNVSVLHVNGNPESLLDAPQADLDRTRGPLLAPFGRRFEAPNRVALYLFDDGSWVVENFDDQRVTVKLDGAPREVPARLGVRVEVAVG